jgi:hypothetical protein
MNDEKRDRPSPDREENPAVAPRDEGGDVAAGHAPPELQVRGHEGTVIRGHEPPADIELGHSPPEGGYLLQPVGEMHSPPQDVPQPTAPPPKPADAAQSVRPPSARHDAPAPESSGRDNE